MTHKAITIDDIKDAFTVYQTAPVRPKGLHKYKPTDVIDENQSVKWNREQIKLANDRYAEEAFRIRQERTNLFAAASNIVIDYIKQELNISDDKARLIWTKLWDDKHSYLSDFYYALDDEIEYLRELL